MHTIYTQNKHSNNNSKLLNLNIFYLLIIYFVHFSFFNDLKILAQKVNPNGYNIFYFQNGNISSEGILKDGKPTSYWKTYYDNGQIKSEGNRKNFLLDSVWKFYSNTGYLIDEITYKENRKDGFSKFFDKQG